MQAKAKIMVVRDIERDDIEYISKTLNCLPIAHVDHMKPEKLGHADRVDEVQVSQVSQKSRAVQDCMRSDLLDPWRCLRCSIH